MKRSGNSEDKFAQQWSEKMNAGEVTPPESVWAGIDRELANQEVVKLKKKAFYYKWAAVIAILIAFSVSIPGFINDPGDFAYLENASGSIGTAVSKKGNEQQENSTSAIAKTVENKNFSNANKEKDQLALNENKGKSSFAASADKKKEAKAGQSNVKEKSTAQPTSGIAVDIPGEDNSIQDEIFERSLLGNTVERKSAYMVSINPEELLNELYVDPIYMFTLPQKRSLKRSNDDRQLWAGVEVGSGTYNPNYQAANTNVMATALLDPSAQSTQSFEGARSDIPIMNENIAAGMNYQVGMNVGMEVFRNVTLESGIQYSIAQATTQTNIVLDHDLMTSAVALTSEASSNPKINQIIELQEVLDYKEGTVNLNNTFQFAAVPVKAGYIILDNKFNLRVNAGMIANVYLGNELNEASGEVRSIDINPGNNSPYRDLSWTGTAGVSLGYQLQKRLNLVVEPNYTYAITPLTKAGSSFDFSPTGLGVMAGLRFNLK